MSIFNFNSMCKKSQRPKGFLLIEASIALLLLITLSLGIGHWYSHTTQEYNRLCTTLKAHLVARSVIQQITDQRALPKISVVKPYTIIIKKEKESTVAGFTWVTVSIEWQENNKKKHVTLTTGVLL